MRTPLEAWVMALPGVVQWLLLMVESCMTLDILYNQMYIYIQYIYIYTYMYIYLKVLVDKVMQDSYHQESQLLGGSG